MICNVLVVIFYGENIYSIGEVKAVTEKEVKLLNGVTFKFTLTKLIKECINARLSQFLEKLRSKNYDFTQDEKT